MKSFLLSIGFFAASGLGKPRGHYHGHLHDHEKRAVIEEHVSVTVVECWLKGRVIPQAECQQGIKNGTLRWADNGSLSVASSMTTVISKKPAPTPAPAPAAVPALKGSAEGFIGAGKSNSASNVDREFPDGVIDCSTFPSDYGAVATNWLNLGGWSSVQKPNVDSERGYSDILGVTRAQCTGSGCCLEGSFCSYACPEGYLKWQWPEKQGAEGQSIGGLHCRGGKLYRTNLSRKSLCAPGTEKINVWVQNKLGQNVAICKTNYPGDESMTIPINTEPGSTRKLACPDSSSYYRWLGKPTSAQYYINLPGYSVEKACVWGTFGDDFGNWAPTNLGVGWTDGRAWVSILPNYPTQKEVKLPYTIEVMGDALSDKCRYQNGRYCSGQNYGTCNDSGCTVSAASGNIYYVLS